MENKDYMADNCYNLMCSAVAACFVKSKKGANKERIKKIRTKFANSDLLQIFCDCSDSFESGKMKKRILEYLDNNFDKIETKGSKYSKVISKAVKAKIINLRSRGYTYDQIGAKNNCSGKTARAICLGIKNNY